MTAEDTELARAAASLTVEDFEYLEGEGMIPEPEAEEAATQEETEQETNTQEAASEESAELEEKEEEKQPKRKRRKVEHVWPDAGAVLEAEYRGVRYECEVIEMPRLKSGKALLILNGPARGEVCNSPSGAMLKATERQREEDGLGRKGVSNGWTFWKVKGGGEER